MTEQVVNHRPRTSGKTKYGLGRTFNVVLDLILIRFLQRYAQRPIHFFGRIGFWSFAMAIFCFIAMLYFKWIFPWPSLWWDPSLPNKTFVETPLPSSDGHVLSGRRHEHPAGHPVRADHADLLRVAGQDDIPPPRSAARNSPVVARLTVTPTCFTCRGAIQRPPLVRWKDTLRRKPRCSTRSPSLRWHF